MNASDSSTPDELVGLEWTDELIGQERLICKYGLKDRPVGFVGCHDGVWAQEFNEVGQMTGWRFWRDPGVAP